MHHLDTRCSVNSAGADAEGVGINSLPPLPNGEAEGLDAELIPSLPFCEGDYLQGLSEGEEAVVSLNPEPLTIGEPMTLQDFLSEMTQALGPWDTPKANGKPSWRSPEEQRDWFLAWKKGEVQRQKQEQERLAGQMPEAVFMAELQAM